MRVELIASAGASATALMLKSIALDVFGLPISAVVLALAGGLAGLIHLPPPEDKPYRFPAWAVVLANGFTGCALTLLVAYIANINESKLLGPLCFLIAYAPIPVVEFVRARLGVPNGTK